MRYAFPFLVVLALIGSTAAAHAKSSNDLQREYVQVRKIALKDGKVQEAFNKANERLNERILEIDPALKLIVEGEHGKPVEARKIAAARHPSPAPTPVIQKNEHIVVKGETLTFIAEKNKVSVVALKKANHITDERKLRVGQKLIIPGGGKPEATPHQAAKATDTGGLWNDLKKDL